MVATADVMRFEKFAEDKGFSLSMLRDISQEFTP